jgi:hypothetical protein
VPGYVTTGKSVSDIRICPLFSGRGDDARSLLRQREASGISEVMHTSVAPNAFGNPVVGRICSVADENHAHVRRPGRPDRSGAIRDDENFDLETRRHAVDLLVHRARITIDVNVSQLPVRFATQPRSYPEPATGDHQPWGLIKDDQIAGGQVRS